MASKLPMDNPKISDPGTLDEGKDLPLKSLHKDPFYLDLMEQIANDPAYTQLAEQMHSTYIALCEDRLAQFDAPVYYEAVKQVSDNRSLLTKCKRFREALMQDPSIPGKKFKLTDGPPTFNLVFGKKEIEFRAPKIRETARETWLRLVELIRRMVPDDDTMSVDISEPNKSEEPRSENDSTVRRKSSVEYVEDSKKAMFSGADINKLDEVGRSTLHKACSFGKVKKAEFLIDNGVDIGITDIDGNTALHYAAGLGHVQCVDLLIKRGADVTLKNSYGDTTYGIAVLNNQTDVMKLLTEYGVMNLLLEEDASS